MGNSNGIMDTQESQETQHNHMEDEDEILLVTLDTSHHNNKRSQPKVYVDKHLEAMENGEDGESFVPPLNFM